MQVLGLTIKAIVAVLALLIGVWILGWIICNEFIFQAPKPEYQRPPWAGPLGIAPAMIAVGFYWASQVVAKLRGK